MKTAQWQPISTVDQLVKSGISLDTLPERKLPTAILMCPPDFFEVKDVKNPFMQGNVDGADCELAKRQWQHLRQTFEAAGHPVRLMEPGHGLEDMVFTANQVLPYIDAAGKRFVVTANMVHESRRREVPLFADWFAANGYAIQHIGDGVSTPRFEGQGDALWHADKQLLWGGFGSRTEESAYDALAELLGVPIIKLELVDPKFYHLDTAFAVLSRDSVMLYEPALSAEGMKLVRRLFKNVLSVPPEDANNFACNAVALGRKVVLQKGSQATCGLLREHGFDPIEVDTSEFMKSGGSVFCLKMQVY